MDPTADKTSEPGNEVTAVRVGIEATLNQSSTTAAMATKRAHATDLEEEPPKKRKALLSNATKQKRPQAPTSVDISADTDETHPSDAPGTNAPAPSSASESMTMEVNLTSREELAKEPSKTPEPSPPSDSASASTADRSSEEVCSATATAMKVGSAEDVAKKLDQESQSSAKASKPTAATNKLTNNDTHTTPPAGMTKPTNSISGNCTNSSSSTNKKATISEPPKTLKGLRHFSMMVCKKVEEKATTTYNEVADELVQQVMEARQREDPQGKFDEKNIRRRVYDSINVLLAMGIISKDKKQISWKGLPTMAHHDIQLLEREEQARKEQVKAKRRALKELLVQQICFRNLVRRNKQREMETVYAEKVPLPFIIVNTSKDAIAHCNMAPDLHNVMFEFDRPFEINDDNSILTRLGM